MKIEELIQLAIPIVFTAIGGLSVWFVQSRVQQKQEIEQRLQKERRDLYLELVTPLIQTLVNSQSGESDNQEIVRQLKSLDYKKKAFMATFFASDEVILAFNNLWETARKISQKNDPEALFSSFEELIFAMRKSMGHRKTILNDWDLIEFVIPNAKNALAELKRN